MLPPICKLPGYRRHRHLERAAERAGATRRYLGFESRPVRDDMIGIKGYQYLRDDRLKWFTPCPPAGPVDRAAFCWYACIFDSN